MTPAAHAKRASDDLAIALERVQLVVFIVGAFLITSQMLLLRSFQAPTFSTSSCDGEEACCCQASVFTTGLGTAARAGIMGPFISVAGMIEDLVLYGFLRLSGICSNTSTISLFCLTGRVSNWPRSPFVSRMELLSCKEIRSNLEFWARIALSFICQATNLVAIFAYSNWIMAPMLSAKYTTNVLSPFVIRKFRGLTRFLHHLGHTSLHLCSNLVAIASFATILVVIVLIPVLSF
jgi:hypothetical protein